MTVELRSMTLLKNVSGNYTSSETLAIKLQRSTILRDSADDIFRSTGRHVSFNFEDDLHFRIK